VDDGVQIAGIPGLSRRSFVDKRHALAWGIGRFCNSVTCAAGLAQQIETFLPAITNDGTYIRALSRIGFGFLNPAGVIRIAQNLPTFTLDG